MVQHHYSTIWSFSALVVLAFLIPSSAQAGFEWLPPTQNPEPTIIEQYRQTAPVPPAPVPGGGFPASPVISEPLGLGAPTSIVPGHQHVRSLSGHSQGLIINPYPLQNLRADAQPAELTSNSVGQAMAEESRLLNPLKLGAGLKTGAQPVLAPRPSVQPGPDPVVERAPLGTGLTPFAGREPAPLPGTAYAPAPRTRIQPAPLRQYADAIGFGKKLPLALALSQVIPSDFTHSFADGVDAGAIVSWEGGKPWNLVLEDMLRPQGMTASIQGNQVMIKPLARL